MTQISFPIEIDENGRQFFYVPSLCPGGCGGSGLYSGFAEPKGTANVCRTCNGSGTKTIKVILSDGQLVRRDDISLVRKDSSSENRITYEEFIAGKRPT